MRFDGYEPIKTDADRRVEKIDHIKQAIGDCIKGCAVGTFKYLCHRLSPITIGKEVASHVTERVIPHGNDELGNVLFSGSAYLPWPGNAGPEPIDYEQAKAESARLEPNHDQGRTR